MRTKALKRPTRAKAMREARRLLKPKCERCPAKVGLEPHHRNRDWSDNRPENVETLCERCHDREHKKEQRAGGGTWAPQPPLTDEELVEAARYYVERLVSHLRRKIGRVPGVSVRSPRSRALQDTRQKYNYGIHDNLRLDDAIEAEMEAAGFTDPKPDRLLWANLTLEKFEAYLVEAAARTTRKP